MKTIETLVYDIHEVLEGRNPLENIPEGFTERFGNRFKELVESRIINTGQRQPRLSPSMIGKPCERQIWLSINQPEFKEKLQANARLKFLYGDFIEELILFLAELAGHKVEGRQDVVKIEYEDGEGIYGQRDAVIDGVLCDVKSASTYSFNKFRDGKLIDDDPFGYIGQIQTYLEASQEDPIVTDKNRCAFIVMDKTLGHICVDIHNKVPFDVREITRRKIDMVKSPEPPERKFDPIPDGKSGNMVLPMTCSYCDVKYACHPNLRAFLYSKGPVYFTHIERLPKEDIPELLPNLENMV